MIHDVKKPEISPAFTISDIHKIREWHYEILKDATKQERLDFYNNSTPLLTLTMRKKVKNLMSVGSPDGSLDRSLCD